jgi:hypothetical protein
MDDYLLEEFDGFVFRVTVLYLCSSLMMEIDYADADDRLIDFCIAFIVFFYYFAKEQSVVLCFLVVFGKMGLFICWGIVFGWLGLCAYH